MSDATWRARPTVYKGIRMRSRLEASVAAWLDSEGDAWEYEPVCFGNAAGQYLPDFRVTGQNKTTYYLEVKPANADHTAALKRMHVIRSSEPRAFLAVITDVGVYPAQRIVPVKACNPNTGCRHCGVLAPGLIRDARGIPTDAVTGRATIGGRARKDVT